MVIFFDVPYDNSLLSARRQERSQWIVEHGEDIGAEVLTFRFNAVQSYKGLEVDVVLCLKHLAADHTPRKMIDYVAYRRARYLLYVINCGDTFIS